MSEAPFLGQRIWSTHLYCTLSHSTMLHSLLVPLAPGQTLLCFLRQERENQDLQGEYHMCLQVQMRKFGKVLSPGGQKTTRVFLENLREIQKMGRTWQKRKDFCSVGDAIFTLTLWTLLSTLQQRKHVFFFTIGLWQFIYSLHTGVGICTWHLNMWHSHICFWGFLEHLWQPVDFSGWKNVPTSKTNPPPGDVWKLLLWKSKKSPTVGPTTTRTPKKTWVSKNALATTYNLHGVRWDSVPMEVPCVI